jgi:hypothetical protein
VKTITELLQHRWIPIVHTFPQKCLMWASQGSSFTLLPTSRRVYVWRTTKEAYNPVLWWFGQQYHDTGFCWSHYYPSWPNYCKGVTWTGWVIRCIPWSRHFRTTMQFSKDNNAPIYAAATVHSSKSMKVNFSIFPGQHNHLFWRLVWGTASHLQHL